MSCFLFPKSLCYDFNRIYNRLWWKQKKQGRGIHWCTWSELCLPKSHGGMGFRNMLQFNTALLARQGWRLLMNPTSLAARILKVKYYRNGTFLTARLGSNPSYTWKSIWCARGLIESGICWRVGDGRLIEIWGEKWIPRSPTCRVENTPRNGIVQFVHELIHQNKWNEELILNLFDQSDALNIMQIPLPEVTQDDSFFWHRCNSGSYSTKSGYRVLADSTIGFPANPVYNRLWSIKLPAKIHIHIWRVLCNYLSTKANLLVKHVTNDNWCPRCGEEVEDMGHIFVACRNVKPVWVQLGITWPDFATEDEFINCLQEKILHEAERIITTRLIAMWAIWGDRNNLVHEHKHSTVTELSRFITSFCGEWSASQVCLNQVRIVHEQNHWIPPPTDWCKLNFDASFIQQTGIAGIGAVIRNSEGEFLACFHDAKTSVSDAFTAEAYACKESIKFGVEKGFDKVIIEGDSLATIKRLKSTCPDFAPSGHCIMEARRLLSNFSDVKIQHTFRGNNTIADILAKRGRNELERIEWFEEPPDFLLHFW